VEGLTAAGLVTAVTSLLVAVLGFAGVAFAAILLRRTGKGTLNVSAAQVNLTDRQFQARWEERLEDFTKMQATNFGILLERAGETNDRLMAEVTHQGTEIKEFQQTVKELRHTIAGLQDAVAEIPTLRGLLAACEARDALRDVAEAERDAKIGRMAREIRRLGGDPEC
jgi:uncharacterized protein HemX